jgi:MerR family transcriptional regulator, Zn(II)-responsive regulator of zntA
MSEAPLGPRALARLTGVSTDTLRHYERLGLLPGTARTRAGYRRYGSGAADRVRLIQRALVVGFSLKELAQVLGACQKGSPPCGRVRSLVGARLDRLEARLEELIELRDNLRTLLRDWDARLATTPAGQRARLLDMLDGRAALDNPGNRARVRVGRIDL